MDARGILAKLRSGTPMQREELIWFADGLANGDVDDAQAGAFAMGICNAPLTPMQRVDLTIALR